MDATLGATWSSTSSTAAGTRGRERSPSRTSARPPRRSMRAKRSGTSSRLIRSAEHELLHSPKAPLGGESRPGNVHPDDRALIVRTHLHEVGALVREPHAVAADLAG